MDKVKDLKERTKKFAILIIRFIEIIPKSIIADIIIRQLLRSATSVGANYRAACRAKSRADFIFKMSIVEEEIDESLYWLEILIEVNIINKNQIQYLFEEGNQILSIIVASINTARKNK
ncbi:four helix bundle protein [Candidatus Poribacteria bacterium]|nr:four helix bundle protein [Candidatus Poribacteria bacterium]